MRCVAENERFAVYDDFLAPADFEGVWRFLQAQEYEQVHARGWAPVWRLHDGEPLGGLVVHSAQSVHAERAAQAPGAGPVHVYPTGTHIDRLVEEISLKAKALEPLVGAQGREWTIFTARAFLYPKGTALGWHMDRDTFTGAFSYYAHPQWSCDWGGEIFVARIRSDTPTAGVGSSPLDQRAENAVLQDIGAGDYVSPKPNRLVVLAAGAAHRINPVQAAAGSNVRCSIAGFFVRRTPEEPAP